MIVTIRADVDRYGSIAERWPEMIVLNGSTEQIKHFMKYAMYEAGCTDLFLPGDKESETILGRL